MTDHVTLLGTKGGPALRQKGSLPTASVLHLSGQTIVIDCAIGVTRSLVECGYGLLDIDAIFITHLHSDHVLELGPLLYTAWTTGLSRTVPVFGPVGTGAYWHGFLEAMAFDRDIREADEGRPPMSDLVHIHELSEGTVCDLAGVSVSALRVEHPPVTETFALRFEGTGKCAVFSADTRYFPPLASFAKGADILVHEAMLAKGVERLLARTPNTDERLRAHLYNSHTEAADAARIANEAGASHLVLNHLVPADDPEIGAEDWLRETGSVREGKTTVGADGLTIEF